MSRKRPSPLPRPRPTKRAEPPAHTVEIGWCEWVALPELGVARLKAKIDTGARTSALHAISIRPVGTSPGGRALVELELPSGKHGRAMRVRTELVDFTLVRDSGGHAERRPVLETVLWLGGIERRVRVSLTNRGDMVFPMLVGRTALGPEFRISPTARYLHRPAS